MAAILRFYDIGKSSFWIDELVLSEQSVGMGMAHAHLPTREFLPTPHAATALRGAAPWWKIWTSLEEDQAPPLYLIALRGWRACIGEGDLSARALSAVFSLLAVLLLYFIAEPLHGRTAAMWACLIMALAGPQIEFAQETGSYTMAMALTLATVVALVRIEKRGLTTLRLTSLAFGALAALLTSYCAAGAVVAIGGYAAIRLHHESRRRVLQTLLISAVAFIAGWGPFLLRQPLMFHDASFAAFGQNVLAALLRWLELPVHLFVNGEIEPQAIALWSAMLYFVPFLLLRRRPDLLFWAIWLIATTLPLAIIDATCSTSLVGSMRHVLIAAPAAYVMVAAFLADQVGYRKHIIAIVLSLCCILTLPDAYVRWKEDWRGFAEYVATRCRAGDVMVLYRTDDSAWTADAIYLALSHYLPQSDRNGSFEMQMVVLDEPVSYALLQKIYPARRVWVVNPGTGSMASDLFPVGKVSEERRFPLMPFAATIARIEPTPLETPFIR